MRFTMETDYAIRIVYSLAKEGKRMDAKSIAEESDVTLRFSLKILRKLVAAGIVKSFKGTQGGYEIGRPLDEISLYDVIRTVEGDYVLTRCQEGGYECGRKSPCKFRKIFCDISRDVAEKLESHKFSDFM
jgi:Rrf2 family protein